MNFALILLLLLLATGVLWCFDHFHARKRRSSHEPAPWWVEYGASFFPVIVIVFGLRSFVVEPFKIPSGSMIPTLLVGDFILVNKWTYGIRLPVINKKVIEVNLPKRGDVMVFRYPADPSLDYIKRVVGLPGDRVEYRNKRLTINGEAVAISEAGSYLHPDRLYYSPQYTEKLGEVEHAVLIERDAPAFVPQVMNFRSVRTAPTRAPALRIPCPTGITSSWATIAMPAATAGCGGSCRKRTSSARPSSSGSISTT